MPQTSSCGQARKGKALNMCFTLRKSMKKLLKSLMKETQKLLPGTMKLHALFPVGMVIYTAEVSCYGHTCLSGEPCGHWKTEIIKEQNINDVLNLSSETNMKRKPEDAELDVNNNKCKIQKSISPESDQAHQNKTHGDDTTFPKPVAVQISFSQLG